MSYALANHYAGEALLSGFNWKNDTDLSNGFVSYQSREDAQTQGLYSIDPDTNVVRLGVDHTNVYSATDAGRPSIRLESQESWNTGLFIADFLHMPASTCGTWPAFWSYSKEAWPSGGELDIIEGANTAPNNIITAHTAEGCRQNQQDSLTSEKAAFVGEMRETDCAVGTQNIGCGFNPPAEDASTYGDGFNAANGGVYAMEWDDEHIRVWHFARGAIPVDIEQKMPDPSGWGKPQAVFGGSSCDVDDYFKDMSLVININFCGDYANALWGREDSCDSFAATCEEYVANNPEAFANSYWDVKYIDAYQYSPSDSSPTPPATQPDTITAEDSSNVATLPNPTSSPANPLSIDRFSYLGCFASSSSFPSFKIADTSDDMTPEACVSACGDATFAGVFENRCFCADSIDDGTQATADEGACSSPCPGDDGAFCGGEDDAGDMLLTLYGAVMGDERPQPPPMAQGMPPSNERLAAAEGASTSTVYICDETTAAALPIPTGEVDVKNGVLVDASGSEIDEVDTEEFGNKIVGSNSTMVPSPPIAGDAAGLSPQAQWSVVAGLMVSGLMLFW